MLILTFHNISEDSGEIADYDWAAYINKRKIAEGRICGHDRTKGWQNLVRMMLEDRPFEDGLFEKGDA